MKKIPETEYVYAAARIHCIDGALLGRDKYSQLSAAPSDIVFSRMLAESGYEINVGDDVFAALEKRLENAFDFVKTIAPVPEIFNVMRYPYDCNNLKAAIKCEFVKGFDFTSLYSPCGTVSEKEIGKALTDRNFSVFPANMAKAAPEVIDEYSQTRDPQIIDIRLDCACCADMLALALESKENVIIEYVKNRIDMINFLVTLRVMRMGKDAEFLKSVCSGGGTVSPDTLSAVLTDGEAALVRTLKETVFAGLFDDGTVPSFSETERKLDGRMAETGKKYKNSVFGPASILWYLCAVENEIKNIRIIIAGHAGSQPAETIIERIRESYV